MSFWKELRDRRLFRVVAGYAAVGWIALEAVDQFTQQGVLPDFLYELVLIWYLVGLPAAVVIGWFHGEKGKQRAPKSEIVVLLGLLVVGVVASGRTIAEERSRLARITAAENALDLRTVAVLYFDDLTTGAEAGYLADGLTEALIDELSTVRELDVVSRNGVAAFKGEEVPYDSIGKVLDAGTLVHGTVRRAREELQIGIRLVDGQSGMPFPQSASFKVPADELVRARDEVVDQAARLLREWLGEEVRVRRTRSGTESVTAWALYHRGEKARKDAEQAAARGRENEMVRHFERADSLLVQAQVADPDWPDPAILQAYVAFRRSRMESTSDIRDRLHWIERGLDHIARAMELDDRNAAAFEVRGTLKYWRWLQHAGEDPERQARLLSEARQDLERAVELDPSLASAHASLAHLYLNASDIPAALLAGRRAYEEDAYLENADLVVHRIVNGAYNLQQFPEAHRWCEIGQERFPHDYRFVLCELLLMNTPELEPDADRAWALLARMDSLMPHHQAASEHLRGLILVGGVLGRAGLPDSADNVLLRARDMVTPEIDPSGWTYFLEAHARTVLGDENEAIDLLKRYAAMNPGSNFDHNWWWRPLRDHPRWSELTRSLSGH